MTSNHAPTRGHHRVGRVIVSLATLALLSTGCASNPTASRVVFLEGAGHFGAGSTVRKGLRKAGYKGRFEEFVWTSFLLWGADHLIAARSGLNASRLADKIVELRRTNRGAYLALMGLSAGSNVVLSALERLPDDVSVDYVVLFQPSVSSKRNLAPALRHVKHRLFATCSEKDAILATMLVTADGKTDTPAGRSGFRPPRGLSGSDRRQYAKVVNLPWRPRYRRLDWNGGHVASTSSRFVKYVIGPRIRGRTVTHH